MTECKLALQYVDILLWWAKATEKHRLLTLFRKVLTGLVTNQHVNYDFDLKTGCWSHQHPKRSPAIKFLHTESAGSDVKVIKYLLSAVFIYYRKSPSEELCASFIASPLCKGSVKTRDLEAQASKLGLTANYKAAVSALTTFRAAHDDFDVELAPILHEPIYVWWLQQLLWSYDNATKLAYKVAEVFELAQRKACTFDVDTLRHVDNRPDAMFVNKAEPDPFYNRLWEAYKKCVQ